jgi:hypothetical protein
LTKKTYRSVAAVVGAISFGIYTGFIPTELLEMAKLVGLTKIAADILEKAFSLGDAENNIKNEDLYFLWKAKRLTK